MSHDPGLLTTPSPRRRRRFVRFAGASAAGLALSAGGASIAAAATLGPRSADATAAKASSPHNDDRGRPAVVGTVSSVDPTGFAVVTSSGAKVPVQESGSTTYLGSSSKSTQRSQVTAGTRVAVFGATRSGTLQAAVVDIEGDARTSGDHEAEQSAAPPHAASPDPTSPDPTSSDRAPSSGDH